MGWNSWNYFGCSVTEADVEAAARALARQGLASLGYRFVNLDDCWQAPKRTAAGELAADPQRFPHGIAALSAYVHSLGLKFGIYATPGAKTCGNLYNDYPGHLGSLGHERQDARTFARWGVDYLKYDWCKADRDGVDAEHAFTLMRDALAATGRPIVYSIHSVPEQPIQSWRPRIANLWRTTRDIKDTWSSMIAIARANAPLSRAAGPGRWNDPDMLEVGNGGMTPAEYRTHFSLWCMMSAPLLLGNDLGLDGEYVGIVANSRVIAVDQDALGAQAQVVDMSPDRIVLSKRLADGDIAVSLTNTGDSPRTLAVSRARLGLSSALTDASDLWTGARSVVSGDVVRAEVDAHATTVLLFSHGASSATPAVTLIASQPAFATTSTPIRARRGTATGR